jgi:hypothetical protein
MKGYAPGCHDKKGACRSSTQEQIKYHQGIEQGYPEQNSSSMSKTLSYILSESGIPID